MKNKRFVYPAGKVLPCIYSGEDCDCLYTGRGNRDRFRCMDYTPWGLWDKYTQSYETLEDAEYRIYTLGEFAMPPIVYVI
jgi:hypothetical protein